MRLDRLLTLAVTHPVSRLRRTDPSGKGELGRLPILMYHSISDDPEEGISPYYRVCTSPARFSQQMACLSRNGYRGVSLSDGLAELQGEADGAPRSSGSPVAIVFDDGFQDFASAAVPVLQAHRFQATVNLPTAYIADTPRQFKHRPCLTWSEVLDLHQIGIEFGAHTVTHPRLVTLPWGAVETEIADSKREIERRLPTRVRTFAYPYDYPQTDLTFRSRLRSLLQDLGFESAVTTIVGTAGLRDNRLELPRLPVNDRDDDALLLAKLQGAYDWFAGPQYWYKRLRKLAGAPARPRS